MEIDYLATYNTNFELEKRNYSLFIKELIIEQKKYKVTFDIPYKIIQDYNKFFSDEHIIYSETWKEITDIYRSRSRYIEVGSDMEIINGLMYSAYLELVKNQAKISYEEYILELSKYYAHYEITKNYESNSNLTRVMYEVNDFSEFHSQGYEGEQYSKLLKKYTALRDGVPINEGFDILSNKGIKNFSVKNESYIKVFQSLEFYDFLVIKDYIDAEHTTFQKFKDVFLKDFNTNDSIVRFECKTKKAAVFLKEIQLRFNSNFNFTNIEHSQKFKSSLDNLLKRTNISDAFTKTSKELRDIVKDDLDYFFNSNNFI